MATATELARLVDNCPLSQLGSEAGEILRELRRIPDLERQLEDAKRMALTDCDIDLLGIFCDDIGRGDTLAVNGPFHNRLKVMLSRLRPQPIVWHDRGDGSIAECDGWTLCIRPSVIDEDSPKWWWSVSRPIGAGKSDGPYSTKDDAKAAAVAWVREQRGR